MPNMDGVLSAGNHVELRDSARVTPAQLSDVLPGLLRSCTDVQAAAKIPSSLRQLATLEFASLLFQSGHDMTDEGELPTFGKGGWTADSWLKMLVEEASDSQLAQRAVDAVLALAAAGFVSVESLKDAFLGLRRDWRNNGATTSKSDAGIIAMADKLVGGGDAEAGARIRQAIDDWQAELEGVGAGRMPGVTVVKRQDLEVWRQRVVEG